MGLMYVLATLLVVGICSADEMVKVDMKTYAHVMMNGMTKISKQANISEDMNKIVFAPKNVMTANVSSTFQDFDISTMNFTLAAAAPATEPLALKRVVGTMMVNEGTLTMHVDVFTAGGNVNISGETTVVVEGDMMITLMVSGMFSWADGSNMLKLKFMIEGSQAPTMAESDMTDGSAYNLGGDGMVILSKKAQKDTAYEDATLMVDSKMVTVSFAKSTTGNVAYTYKFFIKPATAKEDADDTSSSPRVTSLAALTLALIALTAMLW